MIFFHLKLSAYPAQRNLRELQIKASSVSSPPPKLLAIRDEKTYFPSTLDENKVSSALMGDVSPSKSIEGCMDEEVAH